MARKIEMDVDDGAEPDVDDPEGDEPEPELPPLITFTPVAGAEGLPDDVKNGEIPEQEEP